MTIIGLIVVSEICMHINGYYYFDKLFNFSWNIFHQTEMEIKYFKISVPKYDWLSYKKPDMNKFVFRGTNAYVSNDYHADLLGKVQFLYKAPIHSDWFGTKGIPPMLIIKNFDECLIDEWVKMCDILFVKLTQKIGNSELEAYDCVSSDFKNIPSRFVVYKHIYFDLDLYIDPFKHQYDKFFEGVRLKE
jgi:hypothetical protein